MVDGAYSHVASSVERQQRMSWLDSFVSTPIAWNVAVELLTRPQYQVFAAGTLSKKISSSWSSLLKEHKKELCDVVLSTIGDASTSVMLKSTLCNTVTHIILQSTPHDWPDPIADTLYLSQYGSESASDTRIVWIQLVSSVADAVNQSPNNISTQQHEMLRKYIKDVSADLVIKNLLSLVEQHCAVRESSLASDALSALAKWYHLGPEITSTTLQTIEVIVTSMLTNPETLVNPGSEGIVEVLGLFNLPKHPQMVVEMLDLVLHLAPLLPQAIEENDDDVVMSLLTAFSVVGINHPSVLLKNPESGVLLSQLITSCCQVRDAISSEFFDYWKDFHSELTSDPEFDNLLDIYRPCIQEMVKMLIQQCRRLEEDEEDVESEQKLVILRKDSADTLLTFFSIIPEEELEILYDLLQDSLTTFERQQSQLTESWIEVALWGWAALTEDFVDEEEWPLKLMRLFNSLPPHSMVIQKMAMHLIGSLAHWLARRTSAIPTALHYVASSLENVELADMATNALGLICDECGESLPPLLEELMEKLELVMGGLTSKQQCKIISCLASQVTYLEPNQGLSLLEKLAGSLPADLVALTQETNQFNLLQKGRLIDGLNFISALLVSPGDPMERDEPLPDRHVMACPGPPKMTPGEKYQSQIEWAQIALMPLVEQTWPIAEAIINGADLDEEFCIPVITYINHVSSALKRYGFASYLPKALVLLHTMFERTGSVKVFKTYDLFCGLYRMIYNSVEITRLLPDEHGHIVELGLVPPAPSASIENPPCELVVAFSNAFTTFSDLALQLFAAGTGSEEIELIIYYYHFCVTPTINFLPRAFFSNVQCVVAVSQFASNVLPALHIPNALKHVERFFRALFQVDVSNSMAPHECVEFQDFKANLFEVMMTNVFTAIGGASPRSTLPVFSDMIHFYMVTYPPLCTSTLESILSRPGFPTDNISMERKRSFLGLIIQGARSPSSMHSVIQDFSVVCRGIESTFLASIRPNQP
jgi:hypothetical protein